MVRIVAAIVMFAIAVPAFAQEPEQPYAPGGWTVARGLCTPRDVWTKKKLHALAAGLHEWRARMTVPWPLILVFGGALVGLVIGCIGHGSL